MKYKSSVQQAFILLLTNIFITAVFSPATADYLSVTNTLHCPTRVVEGPGGKIFVSDAMVGSVFIYDSVLSLTGEIKNLSKPLGIAVDMSGNIYVGNDGRDNVEVYSSGGQKIRVIGDGEILMPTDMVLDMVGNIYVVDSHKNTVKVYGITGQWIRDIGSGGDGPGQLKFPVAVTVGYGPDTELFIADQGHCSIKVFDLEGNFLREFGECLPAWSSAWRGRFARLQSLAVDGLGRVHAADCYLNRVQIFDNLTGLYVDSYGSYGTQSGMLNVPLDIIVTCKGDVVVANSANSRVEIIYSTGYPGPGLADNDADGYHSLCDCNDSDSSVYPGAQEVCDGQDNDCDGMADEGVQCQPTFAHEISFLARAGKGGVVLSWTAVSEKDVAGYNILRKTCRKDEFVKVNNHMVASRGSVEITVSYQFTDKEIGNSLSRVYKLVEVQADGRVMEYGPVHVMPGVRTKAKQNRTTD